MLAPQLWFEEDESEDIISVVDFEDFLDFLLHSQILATLTRCLGTGAYQAVSSSNKIFALLTGRKANKTQHKYVKTGFEKAFDRPAVLDVLTSVGVLLTRPKLADQRPADDQKRIVEDSREAFHSTDRFEVIGKKNGGGGARKRENGLRGTSTRSLTARR